MSFAGHVADMINRLKVNKAMLRTRKKYADVVQPYIRSRPKRKMYQHQPSPEQIELMKRQIENDKRNQKLFIIKTLIISFIITVIIVVIWMNVSHKLIIL